MTTTEVTTYLAIVRRNYGFADQVSLEEISEAVRDQCLGRIKAPQEVLLALLAQICKQSSARAKLVTTMKNTRAILHKLEILGFTDDEISRRVATDARHVANYSAAGSP